MHDNNCEGWARTVSGEFSEEAVRLAGKAKLERAELDALAALQPREAMIPPSVFKRMLDRENARKNRRSHQSCTVQRSRRK
jgi:hypothetical protein